MLSVELRPRACGGYVVVVLRRELDMVDAESTGPAVGELVAARLPTVPLGLGAPYHGRCGYEGA